MIDARHADMQAPPLAQILQVMQTGPMNPFTRWTDSDIAQSIPACFDRIVRMYPQRPALQMGDNVVTYSALNKAANRVAWALLDQCGAGNQNVALLMEHGASLIIGILGALKAGKAFVSLDAAIQPVVAAGILADCRASILLTDAPNLTLATEISAARLPVLNIEATEGFSMADPDLAIPLDALAFIVYTSGTTGTAKGVMHSHRTLMFLMMHHINWLHLCPHDRHVLISRASNIVGVAGILRTLLCGAALLPYDTHKYGLAVLPEWVRSNQISIMHLPTSLYRRMVLNAARQDLTGVRIVQLTSEAVLKDDISAFAQHFAEGCLLGTLFGSTDAGLVSGCWLDVHSQPQATIVPIGYAPDGIDVLMIDDCGRPVAPGAEGEIVVRHKYLPLGYWGQPELTSKRYPTDAAGRRTHVTRDIACRLADGLLIWRGRRDAQVKVHGLRVDTVEVESALLSLSAIREATVVARTDESDNNRLVAYVVASTEPAPTVSMLRQALTAALPAHMIPSVFVFLDTLPLTTTGKIDRRTLPEPARERPRLDNEYVPPRTPNEQALCAIWQDVLALDSVGICDGFLDLGGDSLRAAQIVARTSRVLGIAIPLGAFLVSPTVADIAMIATQQQAAQADAAQVERFLAEVSGVGADRAGVSGTP